MNAKALSSLKYAIGLCLVLALSLSAYYVWYHYSLLKRPMLTSGTGLIIEIKPQSTASTLIDLLYTKHLIPSKTVALQFIKAKGLANKLKAGIYQVSVGESAETFIYRIVAGDVLVQYFRIIEGSTVKQVSMNLTKAPFLNYQNQAWTYLQPIHGQIEGLLLADTYQYPAGSDAKSLLLTANKKLLSYLEQSFKTASPDLPYKNSYELLIAASILEKETAIPYERKLIASVLINRLKKGMPLQMDPTVIYALGESYQGKIRHEDLKIDSAYNTYMHRGLPPSPIAIVGRQAIDAAAHPAESNYLYYVAKGDGSHVFSENYQQQKNAISQYLKKIK